MTEITDAQLESIAILLQQRQALHDHLAELLEVLIEDEYVLRGRAKRAMEACAMLLGEINHIAP